MATETTNLKLSKAENSDAILQTLQANNENFDKIDDEITALNETVNSLGGETIILEASTENVIDFDTLSEPGVYLIKNVSDTIGTTLHSGLGSATVAYDVFLIVRRYLSNTDGTLTVNQLYQLRYINVDSIGAYRVQQSDGTWSSSWTNVSVAASKVSAGTFTGKVIANATSAATLADKQVRNIQVSTTDLTAGTSALATGDIYFVYE